MQPAAAPAASDSHLIVLAPQPDGPGRESAGLSEAQKLFNSLSGRIDERRSRMAEWEGASMDFHRRFLADLAPLIEETGQLEVDLLKRLDEIHGQKGLSPKDRELLRQIALELCESVLSGSDDPEIWAIHRRLSGIPELPPEHEALIAKAMAKETFGVDLGDEEFASADDVFERAREKQAQAAHEKSQRTKNRAEKRAEKKAARPKSAKAAAAEAKRKVQEEAAKLSLRDIYRRLASALHPDRESDPAERARKNELMQQANKAYKRGNLHELLRMQMSLAQIDASVLGKVDEERMEAYCALLREELATLDRDFQEAQVAFRQRYGLASHMALSAGNLSRLIAEDVKARKRSREALRHDLSVLGEPKLFRSWLRAFREDIGERW
jgi:hypothetical protein